MRKFILGFQSGFDGQSPAININLGGDIVAGNTQGLNCTNINSAGSVGYKQAVAALGNADEFDINLIVTPGIFHERHSYVTQLVTDMCEARGDCFYIMDNVVFPSNPQQSIGLIDAAVNDVSTIDSNYVATYYPWVLIKDSVNNTNIYLPPTGEVTRNLALTDNIAFPWFATAGYTRGIVNAVKARKKLTQEDRDTLYKGRINPIATFSDVGTVIWGNKTLQIRESALDRLNVRRLLLQARKLISAVAVRLLFEQNDAKVRQDFLDAVNPILDAIRRDRGLYDFRVTVSSSAEDLDRNQLVGKIYVKPTKSLEFIDIEFLITPTGASFDNI
jgi:phage tail sheath protein FI